MKSFLDQKDAVLEVIRNYQDDLYSSYTVKVDLLLLYNYFSVQNDGVYFEKIEVFVKKFTEFLKLRSSTVRLEAR